jgi:hypothetical protein
MSNRAINIKLQKSKWISCIFPQYSPNGEYKVKFKFEEIAGIASFC